MRLLLDTQVMLWWLDDDPFDRMLVAQSRIEGLTLVTADRRLAEYGVAVLAAG